MPDPDPFDLHAFDAANALERLTKQVMTATADGRPYNAEQVHDLLPYLGKALREQITLYKTLASLPHAGAQGWEVIAMHLVPAEIMLNENYRAHEIIRRAEHGGLPGTHREAIEFARIKARDAARDTPIEEGS